MNLAAAWNQRRPAERRLIAIGAFGIGAILVVTLAWLPLERTRTRLADELPRQRAAIAALQRDADEVKALRAMPAAAPAVNSPLASLATNGGGLAGTQMAVLDDRRVRLTGADVSFAALLEWLRNAQATHGMRVESARLEALPAAGRVRAELVLARS
jgi:type II secretory pathway component PulM